jgi:hypothetical protein
MAANDAFSLVTDLRDALAGLDRLKGPIAYSLARSIGVAAGKVYRDEAKQFAPVGADKWYGSSTTPGLLKSAIYVAFRENVSTRQQVVYGVSWNAKKAPHGHWAEFGHVQRFEVRTDPGGEWFTTKIPLDKPRHIAATPFLRPAYEGSGARAAAAALDRAKVRYPELLRDAYQPADEELV